MSGSFLRSPVSRSFRIAVVTPYYPPVIGGAENQLSLIVSELLKEGISIDLYTSSLPLASEITRPERLSMHFCSPACNGQSSWHENVMEALGRSGAAYEAALILLSSVDPIAAADAAEHLHRCGARVLIRITSEGRFRELDPVKRQSLAQKARFIVHSSSGAAELEEFGVPRDRLAVIPNAVRHDFLVQAVDARGPRLKRSFISAGRLDPKKRLDLLIDAWGLVEKCFSFADLRILGSDRWELWKGKKELRQSLYARAEQSLVRRLEFLPERPHIEMAKQYRTADFAVSASDNEGMSNFILEAMGAGLPVICSDIPANHFVTTGRNGWKFNAGSALSLFEALSEALSAQPCMLREIGIENQRWVKDKLSPKQICDLYLRTLGIKDAHHDRS